MWAIHPFIIRADYSLKRWRDLTNIFDDSKQTAGSKNPLEEIFLATLGLQRQFVLRLCALKTNARNKDQQN
jgi:hypothetical protein